ncbi:MAG: hypothetical protein ETSY1_09140 [Candidatus Entotheonella factor]|uniref:Conjugal transfer protein TrbH n=1 Tax=Entotheonella factor TaxID=1429438 RepID=W4LSH8_ENTF1|nr:MAG: hypothetical protein ETSY1_09140 [Candidatus Entotheonella factor]
MRRIQTVLLLLLLSGCAGLTPRTPELPAPPLLEAERTALVHDLVAGLQGPFPPAKIRLGLAQAPDSDALAQNLAQSLRQAGYGVGSADTDGTLPILLHLSDPAPNRLLVRFEVGGYLPMDTAL